MGNQQALAGQRVTAGLLNSLPADLAELTTGSVTNSTAETTIGTFSSGYPAGDALIVSAGYTFYVTGSWDSTGTPTIRFRLYIGTVTSTNRIYDTGTMTGSGTASGASYWIRAHLLITATGVSGTFDGGGDGTISNVTAGQPVGSTFTGQSIDTTSVHNILLTAQYSAASASNTARTNAGLMARL